MFLLRSLDPFGKGNGNGTKMLCVLFRRFFIPDMAMTWWLDAAKAIVINEGDMGSNILYVHPYLEKWSMLTNIFSIFFKWVESWNHQLATYLQGLLYPCHSLLKRSGLGGTLFGWITNPGCGDTHSIHATTTSCFQWEASVSRVFDDKKLTWLAGKSTMNEDVFPIENGDFPMSC